MGLRREAWNTWESDSRTLFKGDACSRVLHLSLRLPEVIRVELDVMHVAKSRQKLRDRLRKHAEGMVLCVALPEQRPSNPGAETSLKIRSGVNGGQTLPGDRVQMAFETLEDWGRGEYLGIHGLGGDHSVGEIAKGKDCRG